MRKGAFKIIVHPWVSALQGPRQGMVESLGGRVSGLSPFGHARPDLAQLVLPPQPCSLSWALSDHIVLPLAHWPGERRFLSLEAESDLSFRIPRSILCSHHCLLNSFLVSFSQNSLGNPEGKPLKNFALVLCPEASVTVCKHISAGEPFPSCGLPRREP